MRPKRRSVLSFMIKLFPALVRRIWLLSDRHFGVITRWISLFLASFYLSFSLASCGSSNISTNQSSSPNLSPSSTTSKATVVRIGYQKSATVLNALKTRGTLEKALTPTGSSVRWTEFTAGLAMLEGLNVGSIDFAYTGETPPIFAQAADAPLVYVAYEKLGPSAEAILIPKDSPITKVSELKGKKIALNKGSNVHYLLVKALESAGLNYSDITPVFLPPADARAAFIQGGVDAWVIWDPFLAAAEKQIEAKILVDGKGLVANRGFFFSTKKFATENPQLLQKVVEEITQTSNWAASNSQEVANFLAPQLGLDVDTLLLAEKRRTYNVDKLDETVIKEQQAIADTFFKLKLIPKEIKIKDVVL